MGCETDGAGKRYTLPQRHPFSVRPLTAAGERSKSSREPRETSRRVWGLAKLSRGKGTPTLQKPNQSGQLCYAPYHHAARVTPCRTPSPGVWAPSQINLREVPDKLEELMCISTHSLDHSLWAEGREAAQGLGTDQLWPSISPAAQMPLSAARTQPTPPPCHPQQGKSPAQAAGSPRPSSAAQEQTPGLRCFQERAATAANEGINPT